MIYLLYRWKDQIKVQRKDKSLAVDERIELKQLRKKVKNWHMEKEI